jgi:hypothetical protein
MPGIIGQRRTGALPVMASPSVALMVEWLTHCHIARHQLGLGHLPPGSSGRHLGHDQGLEPLHASPPQTSYPGQGSIMATLGQGYQAVDRAAGATRHFHGGAFRAYFATGAFERLGVYLRHSCRPTLMTTSAVLWLNCRLDKNFYVNNS